MERGKKTMLAMLITVVILIAVFSSFGLIFLRGGTPEVTLPTLNPTGEDQTSQPDGSEIGGVLVGVTPETVQSVIATLARPESYYREVTVETFWGGVGVLCREGTGVGG